VILPVDLAKQGRESEYQAILPTCVGKRVKRLKKQVLDKILSNKVDFYHLSKL